MKINKTVLCIIDGLGHNECQTGNAVASADMKNLSSAMDSYPFTYLKASGPEVGLVDVKDPGNSEIGHNAIGAGQNIKQGLALLNEAFDSGNIFKSDTWGELLKAATCSDKKLNVIVLLSDGRLHSDINHLFLLLDQCAKSNVRVSIHALLDGRDVGTQSAMIYINMTRDHIKRCGVNARITTVAGRSVLFMDRYESNTSLLTNAVEVCVHGNAPIVNDIDAAINAEYKNREGITDESLPAFVLEPDWLIKNGDGVLLLNYRGDRALETCNMFDKGKYLSKAQFASIDKCFFAGVMQYDAELSIPNKFLCPPPSITNTLSEHLCKFGVRQYSVTETAKFGHMTYFFNGNRAVPFDAKLETWKEIPSASLDNEFLVKHPEMKATQITEDVIYAVQSNKYDFIKLNLPNPDMVGHTANFDATVRACKIIDDCVGRLIEQCLQSNTKLLITADHGNAEEMLDKNGKPRSSHTNNLVPCVIIDENDKALKNGYGLSNIAATICDMLGVPINPKFNPSIN